MLSTACLLTAMATVTVPPASAGIFHRDKQHERSPKYPLAGNASVQPDKILFEKAMKAMRKGQYTVARLDLQTLLNTYPESEYQMRAKLAVGDTWFHEGGTAALAQAEGEYKDFITFFPNEPEAAEAQMKVADIYFMQMEKPDRDPTNARRAEAEYRTMIEQYPKSSLVPKARQRLRDVQEVLAQRQFEIGTFYTSQENWPAAIARLQTLTDSYPLFSKSGLALIELGDAYTAEARILQGLNITPKAKQELLKAYDDRAAEAYSEVVTRYPMSTHVEDARERLLALNRPVPEPSTAAIALSEKEEQSRAPVSLAERVFSLFQRGPSTFSAAHVGIPPLEDPPQVTAPQIVQQNAAIYKAAVAGKPLPALGPIPAAAQEAQDASLGAAGGAEGASSAGEPLQLEAVPTAPGGTGGSGPAIGATIVNPSQTEVAPPPGSTVMPGTSGTPAPGQPAGAAQAAAAAGVPGAQNVGGVAPVGPDHTKLPPVEAPAEAPAQINDVHNNPQVQTGTSAGAKKAPKFSSDQESSSRHKKKKGVKRLNPF